MRFRSGGLWAVVWAQLLVLLKLSSLSPSVLLHFPWFWRISINLIRLHIYLSVFVVGTVRWVFGETRNSVAYKAPSFELACIHKKRNLGSEGPQSRLLSLNPAHSLHCPSKFDRRRSSYLVSSDDLCISWKHVVLMDFVIGQLNVNSVYSIVDLTWTRSYFGNSELGSFPNWEHIVRV